MIAYANIPTRSKKIYRAKWRLRLARRVFKRRESRGVCAWTPLCTIV